MGEHSLNEMLLEKKKDVPTLLSEDLVDPLFKLSCFSKYSIVEELVICTFDNRHMCNSFCIGFFAFLMRYITLSVSVSSDNNHFKGKSRETGLRSRRFWLKAPAVEKKNKGALAAEEVQGHLQSAVPLWKVPQMLRWGAVRSWPLLQWHSWDGLPPCNPTREKAVKNKKMKRISYLLQSYLISEITMVNDFKKLCNSLITKKEKRFLAYPQVLNDLFSSCSYITKSDFVREKISFHHLPSPVIWCF